MNIKEHNAIEIELFKTIPPDKLPDFIAKYGERVRSIIEKSEYETDREIVENLKHDYSGLQ